MLRDNGMLGSVRCCTLTVDARFDWREPLKLGQYNFLFNPRCLTSAEVSLRRTKRHLNMSSTSGASSFLDSILCVKWFVGATGRSEKLDNAKDTWCQRPHAAAQVQSFPFVNKSNNETSIANYQSNRFRETVVLECWCPSFPTSYCTLLFISHFFLTFNIFICQGKHTLVYIIIYVFINM